MTDTTQLVNAILISVLLGLPLGLLVFTIRTGCSRREARTVEKMTERTYIEPMRSYVTGKVLEEVLEERHRQDQKWGEQNHDPETWLAILGEESGELATAILKNKFDGHTQFDQGDTREMNDPRKEAIQVAAVAVAMVESLDRQTQK